MPFTVSGQHSGGVNDLVRMSDLTRQFSQWRPKREVRSWTEGGSLRPSLDFVTFRKWCRGHSSPSWGVLARETTAGSLGAPPRANRWREPHFFRREKTWQAFTVPQQEVSQCKQQPTSSSTDEKKETCLSARAKKYQHIMYFWHIFFAIELG